MTALLFGFSFVLLIQCAIVRHFAIKVNELSQKHNAALIDISNWMQEQEIINKQAAQWVNRHDQKINAKNN